MLALLGVSDRSGIVDFARGLRECGVDIVATDGTRRALEEAAVPCRAISDLTGFPEMLDGRVKTLHPAVHAGILARRDSPEHMAQLRQRGFMPIDIVAVSLYPFGDTWARGADRDTLLETIDIGGPTMIRAAAKNCDAVTVLVSPQQYGAVLAELHQRGEVTAPTRRRLAAEAFAHVAAYDSTVSAFLRQDAPETGMPQDLTVGGGRLHVLRYGENPHQRGALYAIPGPPGGLAQARQLQGPELSFTNWLDVDSAWRIVGDIDTPAAAVVKHTNPCGVAVAEEIGDAYRRAHQCDPRAAYGGIVGVNRPVDLETARQLTATFLEALVCPAVTDDAAQHLAGKQRLRVLLVERPSCAQQLDVRSVDGGLLVQTLDSVSTDPARFTVATQRAPADSEWPELLLAWRVCRHVKSNAIVVVQQGAAVGVGAGQMSRVEAAELAVARAGPRAMGSVAASDAFFPMADGLETLGRAGVRCVIHPGGSKQDATVIAAADALGMAVVHTGERHFRH